MPSGPWTPAHAVFGGPARLESGTVEGIGGGTAAVPQHVEDVVTSMQSVRPLHHGGEEPRRDERQLDDWFASQSPLVANG